MNHRVRSLVSVLGVLALASTLPAQSPNASPIKTGVTTSQTPPTPVGPPARLESDKSDHDFGTVIEGEVVKHVFHLKSAGEGPLIITQAKPTCGCTLGRLSVKRVDGSLDLYKFGDALPPGTDMEMEAELNTKNKHNAASSKINVFCNDPRGTVTFGLTAMVDTYFRMSPTSIELGELSVADVIEKTCEVTGKRPGPFLLSLEARPLPQGVKCELTAVNPDPEGKSDRWTVKITVGPDCREGNLGYPLALLSDQEIQGAPPGPDGKQPRYSATLMLTGRVRGLIAYDPQYLSFGLVRPGQIVARTLRLQSFDPKFQLGLPELVVGGVNDQQPEFKLKDHFSVNARPTADGKAVEVELTLNGLPEDTDGAFQGRLTIKTGHPAKPELQVLFSGVCRQGVKPPSPPSGGEPKTGG